MSRSRRRAAYTLVEVLTVIVIIIVLLSLLLPSMRVVKEEAKKVQCLSNLHQITFAGINYAHDNMGALVPLKRYYKKARVSFSDDLFPYLVQDVTYKSNGVQVADTHYQSFDIFRCPNAEDVPKKKLHSYNKQILDYGINHYGRPNGNRNEYGASLGRDAKWDGWPHPRLSIVANHSVIYFAEAESTSSPEDIGGVSRGTMEWPLRYSFEKDASIRHVMGYSAARLDGGAEWNPAFFPSNEKWFIIRR